MSRKLNISKAMTLAAALVLSGAPMFSTAASAQNGRDPVCDQQKAAGCVSTWQSLGYWNYEHCVMHQQCWYCPPLWGYMCGMGPIDGEFAARPDEGTKPW
jgi:hypothetical protein